MAKTVKCPRCKSSQSIQIMGNDRKAFSVGKAIGGGLILGGVGLMTGFIGKKGKYDAFCSACGTRFQVK